MYCNASSFEEGAYCFHFVCLFVFFIIPFNTLYIVYKISQKIFEHRLSYLVKYGEKKQQKKKLIGAEE